ncbi:MAG: 4a-hydroxytetrahydrobiopterin dehydratase [Acidobacteriia bacterium]|nr:4a-hydroxytetrahydrobiopterin dehydratase [Terriglobia bacterium]
MTKLSTSEIEEGLKALPGWTIQEGKLTKQFELSSFPDLVSLVVKIGFIAEAANHHPDLLINYRRLTFMLSTHSLGGVSDKDLEQAKQIEAVINRY